MDGAPLNYLTGAGVRAYPVVWLTWGLLVISCVVVVIVSFLVWQGTLRRRAPQDTSGGAEPALVQRPPTGLEWIYVGVGISSVVLLGSAVWTMYALAAVATAPSKPALTIEITGHQWWWEARYLPDDPSRNPSRIFTTANELHIPVGKPVRIRLKSADVIHSFWVPALTGKTDAIPGQTNETWLEADKAGTYLGQCTEYCGKQHAHMALRVIADPANQFASWRNNQLTAAATPASGSEVAKGEVVFESRCGGCHRVRGTLAGGALGPDLTHLMTRQTIAAGTIPNKPGYLSAWIADPQSIKPGTQMPALGLSGPELQAVRTFLQTLS
jgi:cytochrome c oxidase subunit II